MYLKNATILFAKYLIKLNIITLNTIGVCELKEE
jgi:hypothetical protein